MTDLVLTKTLSGHLAPADPETVEALAKVKLGAVLHGKFTRMRNPKFHRKMFALLSLGMSAWIAPNELEYKGRPVAKSFDRFRRDIVILAGHYEAVVTLKGEVRLEAKSLSFASMDEAEFERVYAGVLTVLWDRIFELAGYKSKEEVDKTVNELLRFE